MSQTPSVIVIPQSTSRKHKQSSSRHLESSSSDSDDTDPTDDLFNKNRNVDEDIKNYGIKEFYKQKRGGLGKSVVNNEQIITPAELGQQMYTDAEEYKMYACQMQNHAATILGNTIDAQVCKKEVEIIAQMYMEVYKALKTVAENSQCDNFSTRNTPVCANYTGMDLSKIQPYTKRA